MPGFDRTGPNGEGPRSGRGMGRCRRPQSDSEKETPENMTDGMAEEDVRFGRGRGGKPFGGGRGRGFGRGRGGFGRGRGGRW